MMTKKQRKMGPSLKPGCPPSREGTDAFHLEPAGHVGTQPFMLQVRKLPLQVRPKGGRGTGPPSWLVKVIVSQSCQTLCHPIDCNPPGSTVHGILQARMLE